MKHSEQIEARDVISSPLIPVILCGGTGTRLWPLSRASYPKQYWNLIGENNYSLLQQTQLRLENIKNLQGPIFICNEEHRFIVAEQMRQIKVKPNSIILEPFVRNTAPPIALAALKAIKDGEDPLLLVLAADHEIQEVQQFHKVIESAKVYAESGRLVTFGIIPTSPETGYGYIEAINTQDENDLSGVAIKRFVEKPDRKTAEKFLQDKRFTWNSGMFLFKASSILKEIEKLAPEILDSCKSSLKNGKHDLDFFRLEKDSFKKCPNLAIDVAVMEKTNCGIVLPLRAGWNDVGSWKTLWECGPKDSSGNVKRGNVITTNTKSCYLRSEHRLVVGIGLENIIVVETDDAILIADINEAQKVKSIVQELEKKNLPEAKAHKKIYRPWGNYTSIVKGDNWQVKKIEVLPGASLSLQKHNHRAEHWVIVKGTALIQRDKEKQLLNANQSTYIPIGCKHRLSNPGEEVVELIEIQSGNYLGEDDIIRFDDIYGRSNK